MVASIIAALASLFKIVAEFMRQSRDKLLLTLGSSQQKASDLQSRLDSIDAADRARREVTEKLMKNPKTTRDEDEFMRGDDNA